MKNTLNILLFLLAGTLVYDNCEALSAGGGSKVMGTAGKKRAVNLQQNTQSIKIVDLSEIENQKEVDEEERRRQEEEERIAKEKAAEEERRRQEEERLRKQYEEYFDEVRNYIQDMLQKKERLEKNEIGTIIANLQNAYKSILSGYVSKDVYIDLIRIFKDKYGGNAYLFALGNVICEDKELINSNAIDPNYWKNVYSVMFQEFTVADNVTYCNYQLYLKDQYKLEDKQTRQDNVKNLLLSLQ